MSRSPSLLRHRAVAARKLPRIQPPTAMAAAQKAVWETTTAPLPADWFTSEHLPALTAYCNHVVRAAQIEAALATLHPVADLDVFDELTKLAAGESAKVGMWARSMRISHQSRVKAEQAGAHASAAGFAAALDDDEDGLLA
jgi:hypothetical protein